MGGHLAILRCPIERNIVREVTRRDDHSRRVNRCVPGQALELLGVSVPVLNLSVTWPLDQQGLRRFAEDSGVRRIIIVEEPGPFVEDGVKAALWGTDVQEVIGERDETGAPLIPSWGEVDPEVLARILNGALSGPGELAVLIFSVPVDCPSDVKLSRGLWLTNVSEAMISETNVNRPPEMPKTPKPETIPAGAGFPTPGYKAMRKDTQRL